MCMSFLSYLTVKKKKKKNHIDRSDEATTTTSLLLPEALMSTVRENSPRCSLVKYIFYLFVKISFCFILVYFTLRYC